MFYSTKLSIRKVDLFYLFIIFQIFCLNDQKMVKIMIGSTMKLIRCSFLNLNSLVK